ncbi:MAG: zinc ribbon domain-containing protein [Spirochaetaceae bacterium]|nr:zinc ribbon domain-containing protein [Spirochaetaceae bacterium]
MADVSVPGLRTSPSCAAHSCAREARSGTPAAVLQSGAYKLSKLWQRLLCASLVLMLLLAGCATTDAAQTAQNPQEVTPAESESAQPAQEPEVEPIPEPEPFYCPFCGAEIPEDSVFCHKCGEKIEDFGKEKPWHTPESLDELEGEWQNSELGVTINYPDYSLGTGSRMLSFCWQEQDVTYLWQNYADSNGLSLDDIWEKRNAYRAMIHGDVRSDENGSQVGYVLRGDYYWDYYDGYTLRIYAQLKYFVPEKIVRDNIANFLVSPDGSKIKMTGTFRTFSDMNFTLTGTGTVYDKVIYDDWSPYWGEP